MARIRSDGSLDKKGGFYMLCVFCSEAFVYIPIAYYAYMSNEIAYLSCNHPFQLFFNAQFISAIVAMPLGIFSTEVIAAEDTYVRGLAELQAMRYHKIIRLHVIWEFAWLLHGADALERSRRRLAASPPRRQSLDDLRSAASARGDQSSSDQTDPARSSARLSQILTTTLPFRRRPSDSFHSFRPGCYIHWMITQVDTAVCDPRPIPHRLAVMLTAQATLLAYRGSTHVLLPFCRWAADRGLCKKKVHPDPQRATAKDRAKTDADADGRAAKASKLRALAILDANFHEIQVIRVAPRPPTPPLTTPYVSLPQGLRHPLPLPLPLRTRGTIRPFDHSLLHPPTHHPGPRRPARLPLLPVLTRRAPLPTPPCPRVRASPAPVTTHAGCVERAEEHSSASQGRGGQRNVESGAARDAGRGGERDRRGPPELPNDGRQDHHLTSSMTLRACRMYIHVHIIS